MPYRRCLGMADYNPTRQRNVAPCFLSANQLPTAADSLERWPAVNIRQ